MKAFLGQLKELGDKIDKLQPALLGKVIDHLVTASPDDTGAYILSHSIGRSGNVGRRLSSRNRLSAPNTHREEARAHLESQLASIPKTSTRIWVGNQTPHNTAVEYGGPGWRRGGYFVYETLRAKFKTYLEDAKNEVGLR